MIEHRPFSALGGGDLGWLQARMHFAVDGRGDPAHTPVGALFVWNDDQFAPRSGFPIHPHRDVEILTYVRSGQISHEDSLGNVHTIAAGDVQAMHAGSGIRHAEFNGGATPTLLFQIWLAPRARGGAPSWQTRHFPRARRDGALAVLASGDAADHAAGAMPIDADARLMAATLLRGQSVTLPLAPGRAAYLVTTSGGASVNGTALAARDGAAVRGETAVSISAIDDTEIVLVETYA